MTNFISNGLAWFQEQRQTHCTEEVFIGYVRETASALQATISSDDGQSTQNQVTLQKQIFHFIVRRTDLINRNIKLHRGVKIWRGDETYELSYESKDIFEYNDPERLDVVLKAILIDDGNELSP